MFTGLIEEIGTLLRLTHSGTHYRITVAASKVLENLNIGDSIATNGVCLTVAEYNTTSFTADVMPETVRCTNFASLRQGDKLNLERAMPLGGRMGGHMVTGHVDGVGTLISRHAEGDAIMIGISAPAEILKLIVSKGSIAIDGISLTVAAVEATHFSVSLVSHTQSATTLASKRVGAQVNLENDILAKYVQKFVCQDNNTNHFLDLLSTL